MSASSAVKAAAMSLVASGARSVGVRSGATRRNFVSAMLMARRPFGLRLLSHGPARTAERAQHRRSMLPGATDRVLGAIAPDRTRLRNSSRALAVLTAQERPFQGNRVQEPAGVLREIRPQASRSTL